MWVAIEANIGAGKSTLLEYLTPAATAAGIHLNSEPLHEWADWLPLFYCNRPRWAFSFQMQVLHSFINRPASTDCVTERSAFSCRHVFAELLYQEGSMSLPEWQLFLAYYNLLHRQPDHIIYIDTSPEECLRRLTLRARAGEDHVTLQYLQSLHEHYEAAMKRFPGTVYRIDGSLTPVQMADATYMVLRRLFSSLPPRYTFPDSPTPTPIPFTALGYVTYKRTYARRLPYGGTEEFEDTIDRILCACEHQLNCGFTTEEVAVARHYFLDLQCSVSGRMLWQLGTPTVDQIGNASLNSCCFIALESLDAFLFLFDNLMLGCGMGISVQPHHIAKLPPVLNTSVSIQLTDGPQADYIVTDSRQGWVDLLREALQAFFHTGRSFTYSTHQIRPAGTPLLTFGGVASGPASLCEGLDSICTLLCTRRGQRLDSVTCLDLSCLIGQIVVSGNIRRSALLALGSCHDRDYLSAKRWDLGIVPNWRAHVNCSVVCDDPRDLPDEFWHGYLGQGEPYGLLNLRLMRQSGRLCDGTAYSDPLIEGCNPCGEQGLRNGETCVLSEIYLNRVSTYQDLRTMACILYRICKHILRLPCHHPTTERVMHSAMRMGIGVTGYLAATEEQRSWLPLLYKDLRAYDRHYSALHHWPESIRLTTCKPSGTLSLLAATTHGCAPAFAPYYIRRIRIARGDPLCELCATHGFPCEPMLHLDGTSSPHTMVVSFPCQTTPGTPLSRDLSATQQLDIVRSLQQDWCDNNVSCTIMYDFHELPAIRDYLARHFKTAIKSCSFLPRVIGIFPQMPYEEISREQYQALSATCTPFPCLRHLTSSDDPTFEPTCPGANCPPR